MKRKPFQRGREKGTEKNRETEKEQEFLLSSLFTPLIVCSPSNLIAICEECKIDISKHQTRRRTGRQDARF